MYSLFKELSNNRLALEQAPVFLISFLIANTFYKFGAFAPELFAFLATWFILDAIFQVIKSALASAKV